MRGLRTEQATDSSACVVEVMQRAVNVPRLTIRAAGGRGPPASIYAIAARGLSSSNLDKSPGDVLSKSRSHMTRFAFVAGAGALTWGMYDLTYSFLSLSPMISMKYGFFGGVFSTAMIAAGVAGVESYVNTRPDNAFAAAQNLVRHHAEMKNALGSINSFSQVKLYKTSAGLVSLLAMRTPSTEMLVRVKGAKGDAIVYIHHSHSPIFYQAKISSCMADVLPIAMTSTRGRQRLVLAASSSKASDADLHNSRFNELLKAAADFSQIAAP